MGWGKRRFGIGLVSAGVVLSLVAAGCESSSVKPLEMAVAKRELVWPKPPLRPRIRYVQKVAQPADLGIHPSFWQQLTDFLAGRQEEWFIRPTGVVSTGRYIYVADPGAQSLWTLDLEEKNFHKIREAGDQKLVSPVAVALDGDGGVFLADSFLGKVFSFSREGKLRRTISDIFLTRPAGLAYDAARGRLYVSGSASHRVWIFTRTGRLVGSIGHRGTGDGEFNFPTYLFLDRKGALYVTDSLGFRVQIFTPDGKFRGKFGMHGDASGDFARPKGVAVDSEGHVYVVEALFDAVQIFDLSGHYLLSFGTRGLGPGQFWLPGGIFIDSRDRIYVADSYNQRIQIFEYLKEAKR